MQLALESQERDIVEMRKQLNLWTRNTSAREAYTYWAHQQANPNLSEIPITQIPDIMQTNAEKGRPMFYGCLKSDYGASSSSQVDPNEPIPLRTAPPSPVFIHLILHLISHKGNQDEQQFLFDPEIERTVRKLKKQSKASRQLNFEEVEENMAAENNNAQRRTLGDYTIPSTTSCGSSIVRTTVEANNFELKPALIQLV
ncbi:hypothetical protein PIB30_051981 [Stylosanthes scabra]|uniref:Uncharacterized protein n=1 Tax=Stylosanthes scabra TaxID=79078 RepID=A0ABU6RIF4_9FABA|nr:hypothetical protein [Stylosanthes scabra]